MVTNVRTSIKSPISGASVNVSVVSLTEYAVVGICCTPLILTIVPAVVALPLKVYTVWLPVPLNC